MNCKIIPHQETQTEPIFTNNSPFLIPRTDEIKPYTTKTIKSVEIDDAQTFSVIGNDKLAKVILSEDILKEYPEIKEIIADKLKKELK